MAESNTPAQPPAVADDADVHQQLQAAQQLIEQLKGQLGGAGEPVQPTLEQLPPQEALQLLSEDPVGFIRQIVDDAAGQHLTNLKEEAELRGAMNVMRKTHPEFGRFEAFILKEVAALIQGDPDTALKPWHDLLELGLEKFKVDFKDMLKEEAGKLAIEKADGPLPYMEGSSVREMPTEAPSFTRDQIAKMSLDEFLSKEPAINQALQKNRIK